MEEFLVALTIFGTIFGVIYLFYSTRHKERMALIEKGESADLFVTSKRKSAIPLYAIILINLGLLGVGIGLGILLGEGIHMAGMNQEISMPSSIFLCIGLSLLTGFYVTRKMDQKYRELE